MTVCAFRQLRRPAWCLSVALSRRQFALVYYSIRLCVSNISISCSGSSSSQLGAWWHHCKSSEARFACVGATVLFIPARQTASSPVRQSSPCWWSSFQWPPRNRPRPSVNRSLGTSAAVDEDGKWCRQRRNREKVEANWGRHQTIRLWTTRLSGHYGLVSTVSKNIKRRNGARSTGDAWGTGGQGRMSTSRLKNLYAS